MNPTSITNAQLHFAKQLLGEFQLNSLNFDEMYVKQVLYAQFNQTLKSLIFEVGHVYQLSNIDGDFSVVQRIDHLLDQSQDMAELKIIKNMMESNDSNFINKILDFKMGKDIQESSNSIFKTVNTESEIWIEIKNLIQTIRDMSVQQ